MEKRINLKTKSKLIQKSDNKTNKLMKRRILNTNKIENNIINFFSPVNSSLNFPSILFP